MKLKTILLEATENPMLKELESRLKSHDWWHEFSDDHRYWKIGVQSWESIRKLVAKINDAGLETQGEAIWKKTAPNAFKTWYPKKLKEVTKIDEKINFPLEPSIGGDPNKPLADDFAITFKNTRKAEQILMKISKELEGRGLKPLTYKNMGIVFNKPSNQQMQFILNAFNDSDIESIKRILK